MTEETYRGWKISQGRWPEPAWMAIGPNYDAWVEGDGWQDNGEKASAPTREGLIAEIDAWFTENEPTAFDIIAENEGLGLPQGSRAREIMSALSDAGFQIVGKGEIEIAAQAMAEAAKVGPWHLMHDKAPRGFGEQACRNYWRNMATVASTALLASEGGKIMNKMGSYAVKLREMPECQAGYEAYERGDALAACKAVTAEMGEDQSRAFFMGYRDAEIERHCHD